MRILTPLQKWIIWGTIILSLIVITIQLYIALSKGEVLSEVTVTTDIPHILSLQVKPESRIPPVGNDSTPVTVELRTPGTHNIVATYSVTTDSNGSGTIGSVTTSALPSGQYDIAVKGLSHLKKVYTNQTLNEPAVQNLLLNSSELLAGDANPSADNIVNALDISYLSLQIYTSDLRADLTHDGVVNSLDYAALLKNLSRRGDE